MNKKIKQVKLLTHTSLFKLEYDDTPPPAGGVRVFNLGKQQAWQNTQSHKHLVYLAYFNTLETGQRY